MSGLAIDPKDLCERRPQNGDYCERLQREILDQVFRDKRRCPGERGTHGLIFRWVEQLNGANPPGTEAWKRHEEAYLRDQASLRKRLKTWQGGPCAGGLMIPGDAFVWAAIPPPSTKDYNKHNRGRGLNHAPDGTKLGDLSRFDLPAGLGEEDLKALHEAIQRALGPDAVVEIMSTTKLRQASARSPVLDSVAALGIVAGVVVGIYWVVSVGSRVLFPPRNLLFFIP